jgi:hypothetical protein
VALLVVTVRVIRIVKGPCKGLTITRVIGIRWKFTAAEKVHLELPS